MHDCKTYRDVTWGVLQVVMEQLWSHIYMCAKDQHFFLTQTRERAAHQACQPAAGLSAPVQG